jgi:hypothetical protein
LTIIRTASQSTVSAPRKAATELSKSNSIEKKRKKEKYKLAKVTVVPSGLTTIVPGGTFGGAHTLSDSLSGTGGIRAFPPGDDGDIAGDSHAASSGEMTCSGAIGIN